MKGVNKLRLNEATVKEAVQEYFEKRFTRCPFEVTDVAWSSSNNDFLITTVEKQHAATDTPASLRSAG